MNESESRMDRIERGMEVFFRGMAELRKNADESQKNADKSRQKTDESLRRVHEEILELKESQKKTDEEILELKESQKKTDEQIRRMSEKVSNMIYTLGKLGIIDGKIAEDLFYRNVRHVFKQQDISFSDVKRNVKKKGIAEYDIVAVGNNIVLVVEVKMKMETEMIDEFLNSKIPKFRQLFPKYSSVPLIGGVGALVMQDNIRRYAEKKGLYVLTQNGEGGAMMVNRKNFRAKEF